VQHVPQSTPDYRLIVRNENAANASNSVDDRAALQHKQGRSPLELYRSGRQRIHDRICRGARSSKSFLICAIAASAIRDQILGNAQKCLLQV
jgi:hypothetical protein